jgi:hypothetical protein
MPASELLAAARAFRRMEMEQQGFGKADRYVARASGFQKSQRVIFRNCPENLP